MDQTQPPTQEPVQVPVQIPDFQPKPNYLKTIIFSVLIVMTLGLITYLFFQNQKLQKQVLNPPVSPIIQAPSPIPKTVSSISIPPDETANWKTYTANGFTFKYPDDFIVEERDKNFFVVILEKDKLIPQAGISIDSRLMGNLVSYDVAVSKTKESLTNLTTQELSNGIKISGKIGPGFGENLSIIKALLKYKSGALDIETLNNAPYLEIFDQILSTFKFIDDRSVCIPTYQVEADSTELTAKQNYSMRCTEQRSEKDCLSIDLYNQKADDFSIPDKISDCIWKNPTK